MHSSASTAGLKARTNNYLEPEKISVPFFVLNDNRMWSNCTVEQLIVREKILGLILCKENLKTNLIRFLSS